MRLVLGLCLFLAAAQGDVFLNNPRGSNNKGAADNNQNVGNPRRLFRSMNDNAGGYHQAPPMYYYEGSLLQVEWLSSSGCGKSGDSNCEFVLQYMCDPLLRDGTTSNTIQATSAADSDTAYGRHESYEYYAMCQQRQRNMGLYVADTFNIFEDTIQHDSAEYTRQTCRPGVPCGVTQYGFECPEERDYYPYWHPTPWRDIAVFVDDITAPHPFNPAKTICDYYQEESQNIKNKGWCENNWAENNRAGCEQNGGIWQNGQMAFGIDPPECIQNEPARPNHLGSGPSGYSHQYMWTVPYVGALPSESMDIITPETVTKYQHCAMRIRANMTTNDYPRWSTFALPETAHIISEEYVAMPCPSGSCTKNLSVAARTNMLGTVFQDRSFEFEIRQRPATVLNRIHNLNVIGRRGNIVQTFPSVEYDFRPNELTMKVGEWLHPQWTGSDSNAANQAGEGKDRSDRSNMVQIRALTDNTPIPFLEQTLFATTFQATRHAFADIWDRSCNSVAELKTANGANNDDAIDEDPANCGKLNPDYANYFDGDLQKMSTAGTFYYMSSRNNNFSNRSQKGVIIVETCTDSACPVADYIDFIPGDRYFTWATTAKSNANALAASVLGLFL